MMTYATPQIHVLDVGLSDVLTITSGGTADNEPTIRYDDVVQL